MWKDYAINHIKKNRASSISIIAASLIASLFLSLICCLFYNSWIYEIEAIVLEEGDWHGRILGKLSEQDTLDLQNFDNVETVTWNQELSGEQGEVWDIHFKNPRSIYKDMPLIIEKLNIREEAVTYHELLLSRYMIHDPMDKEPPMLIGFYLVVITMVSISLILIIHNSFAVSANARIHQFGIFSSIGATPKQIRKYLLQEATILAFLPILLGSFLGIAVSFGWLHFMNIIAGEIQGRHKGVFQYHPLVYVVTIIASVLTVLVSAWLPARKLSKLTPLEAIRDIGTLQLNRKRHSPILSFFFGIEGELAGNAIKAQKKALRTSTISLTLSFLGFTLMLCFLTLSYISTSHTYFERYQNAWDIMITVENTEITNFNLLEQIIDLKGIENVVCYQKAEAVTTVSEDMQSIELKDIGGLEALIESTASEEEKSLVNVPIIIMDDESFGEYCISLGIISQTNGTIVLNRIWDSINSNFRYPQYIPFINETQKTITFQNISQMENMVEIPILAYTQEVPVLREEYDNYTLVQFIPVSVWRMISTQIGNAETDMYLRILASKETTLNEMNQLQSELSQLIGKNYKAKSENRMEEKITNDKMFEGYQFILGGLCVLLAIIGISNVFSNTLGFFQQRKREFAQYISIGMTHKQMKKMFCLEALIIAGRPLVITIPLSVLSLGFMINASHLDYVEFMNEIPYVPIVLFILAIGIFVAFAYYIGAKKMEKSNLLDTLRNE